MVPGCCTSGCGIEMQHRIFDITMDVTTERVLYAVKYSIVSSLFD
jgi:hypothetical protein